MRWSASRATTPSTMPPRIMRSCSWSSASWVNWEARRSLIWLNARARATTASRPGGPDFGAAGVVLHAGGVLLGVGQDPAVVGQEGDAGGDLLAQGDDLLLQPRGLAGRPAADHLPDQDGLGAQPVLDLPQVVPL